MVYSVVVYSEVVYSVVVYSEVVYSVVTKNKGYYFWREATVVFFSFFRI